MDAKAKDIVQHKKLRVQAFSNSLVAGSVSETVLYYLAMNSNAF